MNLYEFCVAYNLEIELETCKNGYSFSIKNFGGVLWDELRHLKDTIGPNNGGTTWFTCVEKTPNKAIADFLKKIEGKVMVIRNRIDDDDYEYESRFVEVPNKLTIE